MRKKIGLISLIAMTSFSLVVSFIGAFAWFVNSVTMGDIHITGESDETYFAYGDGQPEEKDSVTGKYIHRPFGINTPRHLYNLAWLQFAGLFNKDEDNDGEIDKQYCFEIDPNLTTELNMSGWTIPPIGTETYPFLGTFNGNNKVISNLTVSNQASFDKKPESIIYNSTNQPEVVGFFGVVGDLPEEETVTSVVSIHDFTLKNTIVKSTTEHVLIGIAAGYVNSDMSGVKIDGTATVDVNGTTTAAKTAYSEKLSDYGLVGYTTKTGSTGSYIQKLSEFYENDRGGDPGSDWGGSVQMKNMYNRLYSIAGNATTNSNYAFEKDVVTKADNTTFERNALTGYAYTYRDREEGSFVFTRYSSSAGPLSDYMYLNGGTRYHQIKQTETQVAGGYNISYNGHYLGVSGTSIADHQDAWLFSNNYLSIAINGVQYYLTHDLTLSSTTQETWTRQNNSRLYYTTSSWFTTTYHYITYDNGWTIDTTTRRNDCTQLTWTSTTYTKITESSNGPDYMDYTGNNVTYFPLITNDNNYEVGEKNTGYVIGGSEDNSPRAYPDKTGDIRVSKYGTSDINRSYSDGTLTNVYTINASKQTVLIDESDYNKYANSKTQFLDMVSDGNIYGLHFMPANISTNHLVTAEYALINGDAKTNYEMPASSIDFNLKRRGSINFFAGTYFSGNNSFFSLHEIFRDNNDKIVDIKEIAEIYSSSNIHRDNIYKYSDGSYSATLTPDYSLAFSTERIKVQSSFTTNAVYYFEIPANSGEYALGSVDGGTGAYLMYLDIGSNGNIADEFDAYSITTITESNFFPIGVDFVPFTTTNDGGETIAVAIAPGQGIVAFAVTTNDISVTNTSSLASYVYRNEDNYVTSSPGSGEFTCNLTGDPPAISGGGTRVLMMNLESAAGSFKIRVTDTLNAQGAILSSAYEIDSGSGFVSSTEAEVTGLSAEINLSDVRSLNTVATLTRDSGANLFTSSFDEENCFYSTKTIDVDIETNGTTIRIEVTDGYTFKIGGTTYANGSTYPTT